MNPFNPNSVVAPTLFAGRSKQTLQILKKLEQVKQGMSSNFVFYGERGIGKTALAKLVISIAQENDNTLFNLNFLTSYYSIEKGQSFESAMQASLNAVTDKLPNQTIANLASRMGKFFSNGKFSLGAYGFNVEYESGRAEESKSRAVNLKDICVSAIGNILRSIRDEAKQKQGNQDGIIFVLDEVHNLADLVGAAQIIRGISTTLDMDGLANVSFIIIGYPDAMNKFFEGDPSAKRSFDQIPLFNMPLSEAAEILEKGFKKIGVSYDAKELTKRIAVTGGYPHSVQVLGHNLIEVVKNNELTKTAWDQAEQMTALELQNKDFSVMYGFSGKQTLREEILNFLALVGRSISKADLAKEMNGNIYDKAYLPALKQCGAIFEDKDSGLLTLHSQLFRSAILSHIVQKGKFPALIEKAKKYWEKNSDSI